MWADIVLAALLPNPSKRKICACEDVHRVAHQKKEPKPYRVNLRQLPEQDSDHAAIANDQRKEFRQSHLVCVRNGSFSKEDHGHQR